MTWEETIAFAREGLDFTLLTFAKSRLTVGSLLTAIVLFVALFIIGNLVRRLLERRILPRTSLDGNVRQAIATLSRYVFLGIGATIILEMAGIDMTALNVLAGTIGIGVGLGLQSIANNFISGFVILFERPIKIGDRIQVGDTQGDVLSINARSTTLLTNDNINVIIPNSKILSENVVNWSYSDRNVRFKLPVSVSYESDVRKVEALLMEIAKGNQDVLKEPAPSVCFIAFGDSALNFELRVWSSTLMHRRGQLVSSLNFSILEAFRKAGIEIPFPQRVVTYKGEPPKAP